MVDCSQFQLTNLRSNMTTSSSEYDSNAQPFEPDILRALSAAEVTDIHIDTPEYKKARYEMTMPNITELKKLVHIHKYISEHEGEAMTQTLIGNAIGGMRQGAVSETMDMFPSFFKKVNGTYIVLLDIPTDWMNYYNTAMIGVAPDALRQEQPIRKIDREMNKKLDKILAVIEAASESEREQTVTKSPIDKPNMRRPYLDNAVVDKMLQIKTIQKGAVEASDYDIKQKVRLFYRLIHDFDAMIPEIMEVVSRNI